LRAQITLYDSSNNALALLIINNQQRLANRLFPALVFSVERSSRREGYFSNTVGLICYFVDKLFTSLACHLIRECSSYIYFSFIASLSTLVCFKCRKTIAVALGNKVIVKRLMSTALVKRESLGRFSCQGLSSQA